MTNLLQSLFAVVVIVRIILSRAQFVYEDESEENETLISTMQKLISTTQRPTSKLLNVQTSTEELLNESKAPRADESPCEILIVLTSCIVAVLIAMSFLLGYIVYKLKLFRCKDPKTKEICPI